MRIFSNLNIDFIGKRYFAYLLSFILIAVSVYKWVTLGDQKYGLDYTGGLEIVARIEGEAGSEGIRKVLFDVGYQNIMVQSFEPATKEYSIRLGGIIDQAEESKKGIEQALVAAYPKGVEVLKTDYVGPAVGQELKRQAILAIVIALIGMLIYIAFRFELAFAVGAVMAIFHDVIIATGVYLLTGERLSMAALAAALTLVGYSVNDTIVVFDRIREEIIKRRDEDLVGVINYSLNVTLSRTVITSLLTLFSAIGILIFGGGALREISMYLVSGIIVGTYSTIFIASPVALAWSDMQTKWEKARKK